MLDTITPTEFELAEPLGAAGTVAALGRATIVRWRKQHPSWHGRHWSYTDPDMHGARHLYPINVAPRAKNQS